MQGRGRGHDGICRISRSVSACRVLAKMYQLYLKCVKSGGRPKLGSLHIPCSSAIIDLRVQVRSRLLRLTHSSP